MMNEKNNSDDYVWRCTVCGYIYDSDPLPEHYVCPQCGAPAPKFERMTREEAAKHTVPQ